MEQMVRKTDWEEFLAAGRVPRRIRPEVFESWTRSARLPIVARTSAPILSEGELATRRTLARRLRRGAQTALMQAGQHLNRSNDVFLLCDSGGVVIDAVGDNVTLERARENHLHLGGQWTEEAIGTNAIGTALRLGNSIQIRETEHFCEAIQRWNCAATPITEPGTGRILGVADISWPSGVKQGNGSGLYQRPWPCR